MAKGNFKADNLQEDKLLESRVGDAFDKAERYTSRFVGFLDPHERSHVQRCIKRFEANKAYEDCSYAFWGGYQEAERTFLGVFPPHVDPCNEDFPITAIDITWRFVELTHRDFLGALLALGIVKSKIGDISVGDGQCTVFAEKTVAAFVVQNLVKVGSAGVVCTITSAEYALAKANFKDIGGTVASSRLDCIICALTNLSRSSSSELVEGGLVSVDFETRCDTSSQVKEGSTVSIRGHGRFVVDRIGPQTKKGRYGFGARKYL